MYIFHFVGNGNITGRKKNYISNLKNLNLNHLLSHKLGNVFATAAKGQNIKKHTQKKEITIAKK